MTTQKNPRILFSYFWSLLVHNYFIVIIMIINILVVGLSPLLLQIFNQKIDLAFKQYSLFLIGLPMILLLLFNTLATVILFVKTKKNNVDLYVYISSFKNIKIVRTKQMVIWFASCHLVIGVCINMIILSSLEISSTKFLVFGFSLIISIFLMSILWISILAFLAIFSSFMTSLVYLFAFFLAIVASSIVPIILQQNYNPLVDFNLQNNQQNIIKIYHTDKNNNQVTKIDYAIYENPLATNNNQISAWKPDWWVQYSPFNAIFGLAPIASSYVVSNDLSIKEKLEIDNRFAVNHLETEQVYISEDLFEDDPFVVGFSEETVFDYPTKKALFAKLDEEIFSNDFLKQNRNDSNLWASLENDLKKQNVWDSSLSDERKTMILHLMGLTSATSILFSIFNNYEKVEHHLSGFDKYLTEEYNQDFANFVNFIWTDHNPKLNLYAYHSLGNYDDIDNYHPSLTSLNPFEKANIYDLAFIKDKLFNFVTDAEGNIELIQLLTSNNTYATIREKNYNPKTAFLPTITKIEQFDEYLEQNSTINNLNALFKLADAYTSDDIYQINFRNNVDNNKIITLELEMSESTNHKLVVVYLWIIAMLAIFFEYLKYVKLQKGDLI